jgi:hypothetical protein
MTDTSDASWVQERLLARPFATVGALVPDAFDAYARLLHPAYVGVTGPELETITWKAVAERNGRVAHPLMQFERIAGLADINAQPEWGQRPNEGEVPAELVGPLVSLLREHTTTPGRCYFSLWEGFGGLDIIPNFSSLPRVKADGRDYLLFRGPLDSMMRWAGEPTEGWFEGPQLWWPEDRSWCVATDIDLDSTYIGGSRALIERLLSDPALEAVPALVTDRVDVNADTVN